MTWKYVKGYEGMYEINEHGDVRSKDRYVETSTGVRKYRGKKVHPYLSSGYMKVDLNKDGHKGRKFVHRLLAETFLDNPENLPIVNHKDGDKLNNSLGNLEWCSYSYNYMHAMKAGMITPLKGEDSGRAKLSEKEVIEIRDKFREGMKQKELSKIYSTPLPTIKDITRGRSWAHLL